MLDEDDMETSVEPPASSTTSAPALPLDQVLVGAGYRASPT